MALTFYFHPLSSYCHKALIALYESGVPFTPQIVDLSDQKQEAEFKALWPVRKFPVLKDGDAIIPESTSIIEYLAMQHPAAAELIPADPRAAFTVRDRDRFFDLHIHFHTQKIITDRLRPPEASDVAGLKVSREGAGRGTRPRRSVDGEAALGGRRHLQHGGLRGGAAAVLRGPARHAARRPLRQPRRLSRPRETAPSYARTLKEAEPICTWCQRRPSAASARSYRAPGR
jgi:glutathione S-transferase